MSSFQVDITDQQRPILEFDYVDVYNQPLYLLIRNGNYAVYSHNTFGCNRQYQPRKRTRTG